MLGTLPRPALLHRNSEGRRSRAFHPFLAAAGTDFGGEQLALFDVEAAPGQDLPFVEAGAAEGLAVGAALAKVAQSEDVGHLSLFAVRRRFFRLLSTSPPPCGLLRPPPPPRRPPPLP